MQGEVLQEDGFFSVFPGQGSQYVGMGQEVWDAEVREAVNSAAGTCISKLVAEGPMEELSKTEFLQPALFMVSLGVVRTWEKRAGRTLASCMRLMLGHSLGEYTAVVAAGALSLEDGARIVVARGRAMAQAAEEQVRVVAILKLGADRVRQILREERVSSLDVALANDNATGQVVLSGREPVIGSFLERLRHEGARTVPLPISVPVHSPHMEGARNRLASLFEEVRWNEPICPLLMNATARVARCASHIRQALLEQTTGTVRFRECVDFLHHKGLRRGFEWGPKNILGNLVTRAYPGVMKVFAVESTESLNHALELISA